jgi:TRAP-type C4-dicarboxylate transport system permease small subunit
VSQARGIFSTLQKVLTRINTPLVVACSVLLFLLMFNVVSDVTGRYLFLKPVPGSFEIGEAVLVFVVFLTLASVQMHGQHIRVTVVLSRLSPGWQAWLELLAIAAGFSLTFLMAWQSLPFAINSYKIKEAGLSYPIPVYPAKFACFVGCAMFCIQFFIQLLSHIFTKMIGRIPTGGEKS